MIQSMVDFGEALYQVKLGKAIRRLGWNGAGLTVKIQIPDSGSKNTLPYLYMTYPKDHLTYGGARVPWLASQTDLLSSDWIVLEDTNE